MFDGSVTNAEFGEVSCCAVVVTHGMSTPELVVVQFAGSAGAVTPSKFCENVTPEMSWPSGSVNVTFVGLAAPS